MGTSSSARGASGRSALVPPHADTDPTLPLPAPVGNRFQTFRTVFGRFCEGGGRGSVRSALGQYARTSTGGSSIGPRRFGPAYTAGGSLFGLLGDLRAGGDGATFAGVDLSGLVGRTVGFAAQEIARALAPVNEDADRIRVAIHEAIAEVLPDVEIFDPTAMTADQVIAVLVDFLARVLFRQVTEDAGSAWNKAPSADRTIQAENELFDLIKVAMDRHLGPALAGGVGSLSRVQVERLQQHAMTEVWREWEAYE